MRIFIYRGKPSDSAKALATSLGIKRIRNLESKYRYREGDLVINWGVSRIENPYINQGVTINMPYSVEMAVNKFACLSQLHSLGVPALNFTTRIEEAEQWVTDGGFVYCRTLSRASKGKGIVVATTLDGLVPAGLYTKGETCKREYRVHVAKGRVIDLVAKAKKNGEEGHQYIRNCDNGYVFVRNALNIPDDVKETLSNLAIRAVEAVGLDFGAVDIIRNSDNICKVIEINTAPGIEGTTLERYVEAFKNWEMNND